MSGNNFNSARPRWGLEKNRQQLAEIHEFK